jgi:DNA-binding MarR family transcriptional regulator
VHESYCLKEEQRKSWKEVMVLLKVARLISKGVMQPFEILTKQQFFEQTLILKQNKTEKPKNLFRLLTDEEIQILKHSGLTQREISEQLNIKEGTFSAHIRKVSKAKIEEITKIIEFVKNEENINKIKLKRTEKIRKKYLSDEEKEIILNSPFTPLSFAWLFGKSKRWSSDIMNQKMRVTTNQLETILKVIEKPKLFEEFAKVKNYTRNLLEEEKQAIINCGIPLGTLSFDVFGKRYILSSWLKNNPKIKKENIEKLMKYIENTKKLSA